MIEHTTPALPTISTSAATVPLAASPKGRRRLWQLSTQAHELLLGLSFTPDVLRREAARALGQMHQRTCILKGREVDVLYSVVHDMGARNPVSEAFHKLLNQRHALAVRRTASLRDAKALQAVWLEALAGEEMPAALWALVTHPLGAALEASALYDARGWVFERCRRSVSVMQADAQAKDAMQAARREVEELRARLCAQQQQAADALAAARAEQARLVGEMARLQASLVVPPCSAAQAHARLPERSLDLPAQTGCPEIVVPAPSASPTTAPQPAAEEPAIHAETASQPIAVRGRRVLCVGGIQHSVARYRSRIERLGGHFEHHDGGLEDRVQALDGRLSRAEIVICQAGCINHEAYQRVKRHCQRTGTPCVYLDRPSLSRLDRALHQAQEQRPSQPPAPLATGERRECSRPTNLENAG